MGLVSALNQRLAPGIRDHFVFATIQHIFWWERFATINRANQEMHELGFPPIGLPILSNVEVTVTSEVSEMAINYRSPIAEYGVIWRTLLCPPEDNVLPTYEMAVLGLNDSDSS
jgi:hypothetical protein